MNTESSQIAIAEECERIKSMLLEKNASYGNSALEPIHVFAPKADAQAGIRFRLDDKLTRIAKGDGRFDEDTIGDIIGYLVLLHIAERASPVTETAAQCPPVASNHDDEVEVLHEEIERLTNTLHTAESNAGFLLQSRNSEIERLKQDLDQANQFTASANAAAFSMKKKLDEQLKAEKELQRKACEDCQRECDEARKERDEARAAIAELHSQASVKITSLEACASKLEAERDEAIVQRDAFRNNTALEKAVSERNDAWVQLNELSASLVKAIAQEKHISEDYNSCFRRIVRERDIAIKERNALIQKAHTEQEQVQECIMRAERAELRAANAERRFAEAQASIKVLKQDTDSSMGP
ncbi:MAG: hypothetical protein WC551_07880 [Patescibacteria group bacterium]